MLKHFYFPNGKTKRDSSITLLSFLETLGNLIRHSKGLLDTLEDFAEIYTLFDQEAEEQLTEEVPDDADAQT